MFHNWNLRVLLLPINKARKIYTARSAHSVLNLQNSSTTVCRLFFFAFKKKNYLTFYWGIIALQTFAVFCQASTWISHRYTYTPFWKKPGQDLYQCKPRKYFTVARLEVHVNQKDRCDHSKNSISFCEVWTISRRNLNTYLLRENWRLDRMKGKPKFRISFAFF